MMKTCKKQLIPALLLTSFILLPGTGIADQKYPMDAKLKQCETAFNKAHSGQMTQEEAWTARREHMNLVMDILANLNQRNAEVSSQKGKALSNEEILNNFKVMGRLLEMLAADRPIQRDEWGYPLK